MINFRGGFVCHILLSHQQAICQSVLIQQAFVCHKNISEKFQLGALACHDWLAHQQAISPVLFIQQA